MENMTLIQQEEKLSVKYELKKNPKNRKLVQLSQDNVARVEAMIRTDSAYSKTNDIKNKKSSAYWMTELKKILIDKAVVTPDCYKHIIKNCIEAVDRENSTHINADKIGRKELSERVYKLESEDLLKYLSNPKETNYKLINILSKRTNPTEKDCKPRKNYSFATKFCHYACLYLFEGKKEQDNYAKYDYILSKNIPEYAKIYNIPIPDDYNTNYEVYINLIDNIIKQSGNKISRRGFDHLLWYFHKG